MEIVSQIYGSNISGALSAVTVEGDKNLVLLTANVCSLLTKKLPSIKCMEKVSVRSELNQLLEIIFST